MIYKYVYRLLEIYFVNFLLNYGLWKIYEKDGEIENVEKYKNRFNLICEFIFIIGDGINEKLYFVILLIDG